MNDVEAALAQAQAAKQQYRDELTEETRDAHRDAAQQLRYARWVARGGPQMPEKLRSRADRDLFERWSAENPKVG